MKVPYSLVIVWRLHLRYVPAIFAVTFSAVLSTLECGLLVGILDIAARTIRRSDADIWVASAKVRGFGFGQPIPLAWAGRLLSQPEIERVDECLHGVAPFQKPDGSADQCALIGMRFEAGSLGAIHNFSAEVRQRLTRPGTVVVYQSELPLLGLQNVSGQVGHVAFHRVEIVDIIRTSEGGGLTPAFFASLRTTREILSSVPDAETSYLLARCRSKAQVPTVVQRLKAEFTDMDTLTSAELTWRTQSYWLVRTRAGLVLGFASLLSLFVGAVVTSQTLYGATLASLKEYAVLRALGIPRWRLRRLVLGQSFWVTVAGLVLALPLILVLSRAASRFNVEALLPLWLLGGVGGLTLVVGLLSGGAALRSLRQADPAILLR